MPECFQTLRVPQFAHAGDYAGVWAIEPMHGAALWDTAQRMDLSAHVAAAVPPVIRADVQVEQVGKQSIGVVMLTGPLMKAASTWTGGTSTVQARREIRKAVNDPNISAIMLAIDSPGGTVSGTADLAEEVKQANKIKPVYAFVDDLGASAAYWIASQAEKMFANTDTALVGSIGTLAVVYDMSAMAEKEGVKALVFGTGPLKGAGTPGAPVTEEQQDYFRNMVEKMQQSFDAAVMKGRGLTEKQLVDAKTGGVFDARDAMGRKLIDGIKSFDGAMADLAAEARRRGRETSRATAAAIPSGGLKMEENNTPTAAVDPIAIVNERAAANYERIAGIQRVAADHPAIAAQAIRENWSVDKAELAAMRASLANNVQAAPVGYSKGYWQIGQEVAPGVAVSDALAASMLMSLGRKVEGQYKPEVLNVANDRFKNFGIQQVLMLAAVQNGYSGTPGERIHAGNLRAVLRAAFGQPAIVAGSASTVTMSGILGNVANKELVAGYEEEDMNWKEIAAVKNVSTFHQHTTYRMLDNLEYEEVAPDGKIKHGTANQESYTRQAKTYAKMFALTRHQIINDDLGAFADIRSRIGRGAARKFNEVFWAAFINNSSFFTSARTNYISGATTNLGTDGVGLGLGVKAFRTMTSPTTDNSKRVGGQPPTILLVPPELEQIAEQFYVNQNLGSGTTVGNANIYANKYRPVVAWQLSDSGYTGYSTTAWYLFRNPSYLAPMCVSFLNGMMAPTVEEAEADFDTLGVQFRGYHDFGCDQAEYLAGIKSKGAA